MMTCHAYHLSVFLLLSVGASLHRNYVFVSAKDTCSDPPPKEYTIPNYSTPVVHQEDSRYRYKCIDGYLRKAGTSSLIWCKRNNSLLQWFNVNGSKALVCIPSPKKEHAKTTRATADPTTTSTAPTTTPPTTASKTTLTTTTAPTTTTPTTTTTARTTTTPTQTAPTTTTVPTTTTAPSTIPVMNWKSTKSHSSISPLPSKTTKTYDRPQTPFTGVTTNVKLHTPEPPLGPRGPTDTPGSKSGHNDPQNTSPSTAVQSTIIGSGAISVIVLVAVVLLLWRRSRNRGVIEQVIMPEMLVLMNVNQLNQSEDGNRPNGETASFNEVNN